LEVDALIWRVQFQEVSAYHWASVFGARYISIEHRYYGESLPTPTYDTADLEKYLTVEQALADAAFFVESMLKANPKWNGKWVVFGCSYSGALSAWFRLKYPNLVVGSVAPSGPVLAQLAYPEYNQHFASVAPAQCVSVVKKAFAQMTALVRLGQQAYLATLFNACNDLSDPMDLWNFKYQISGTIGSADQFDNPSEQWPLNATCDIIVNAPTPIIGIALAVGNSNGGSSCYDYSYKSMIASMQDVTSQSRSWQFQTCSEFGFWQSTTGSIFFDDITSDEINALCEPIFGVKGMTPDTGAVNARYGGKQLNATNVIFTNGRYDPWSLLSISTNSTGGGVEAAVYSAGHCATMCEPSALDPPSLVAAREAVRAFLQRVLT
jgi:hypothetical protein